MLVPSKDLKLFVAFVGQKTYPALVQSQGDFFRLSKMDGLRLGVGWGVFAPRLLSQVFFFFFFFLPQCVVNNLCLEEG